MAVKRKKQSHHHITTQHPTTTTTTCRVFHSISNLKNTFHYWRISHYHIAFILRSTMSRSNSTGAVEGNCRTCSSNEHSTRYRNAKHAHYDSKGDFHAPKSPMQKEFNNEPRRRQSMKQEEHSKDHHRRHHNPRRRQSVKQEEHSKDHHRRHHNHRHHNHHQLRKRMVDGAKLSAKLMAAVVFCAVAPILYVIIPPAHDADDRA